MKNWFKRRARRIARWWSKKQEVKPSRIQRVKKPVVLEGMADKLKLAYAIAQGELGVKEIRGRRHNPQILKYHKATSLKASTDEVPWCASFVNYTLLEAGVKGTNSARARSFENWGRITYNPQPGDLAVFYRGSKTSGKGHIAYVTDKEGVYLGGNQGNKVCYQKYASYRLICFRTLRD